MRVTVWKQFAWWGGAGLLLGLILWRLGNVLAPFAIGAGVAYLLDPIAGWLERRGLSRPFAVALITLLAMLIAGVALVFLIPALISQTVDLLRALPDWMAQLQDFVTGRFPGILPERDLFSAIGSDTVHEMSDVIGAALPKLFESVSGLIGIIALLVIAPVVAFYLLLDWRRMIVHIDSLLPREHASTIRQLAAEIDSTLSGFLRGQGLVTLILGSFYAASLVLVGLPYGLMIGIVAALLSIIPYVGVFLSGVIAMGVALFAFWGDPLMIGIVGAIFAFGQLVEGNVLQPKIVGSHVGLHPVWLILALSVFGAIFGFAGLVLAVPLAAMLGVLVRFLTQRYRESALYTGVANPPPLGDPLRVEIVPTGTTRELHDSATIRSRLIIASEAEAVARPDDPDKKGDKV